MGFDILGDVNTGWFAQLAHGCESVGRSCLNGISGSGRWGDAFYGTMEQQANNYVQGVNNAVIQQQVQNGATQMQALNAASAEMSRLANPQNLSDLGNLTGAGLSVSGSTVKQTIANGLTAGSEIDWSAILPWAIGGVAAVGGTLLLAKHFERSSHSEDEEEVRAPTMSFGTAGRQLGVA